jgi:serine protease Do
LFAVPTERDAKSVGSGVIIHEDGFIATNAHVVSAGADLVVTLADGTAHDAYVVGRAMSRDLAVIKIEPPRPLQPITFGSSADLMIGERTIAVGNPVGLQNTVTTGIISALHRDLQVDGRLVYTDAIQTDASINPGNSGGPLLNVLGELIGINMAIRTDAQNIGFAIPVDELREVLPEILDSEKRRHFQLGLRVDPASTEVVDVRPGSPAAAAGIRVGDSIDRLDGAPVGGGVDYHVAMLGHEPGDTISLVLRRGDETRTEELTLAPLPVADGRSLALERLGVKVANVKDRVARLYQRSRTHKPGVIVVAVEPSSPAARAELKPGDLLVSMGPHWLTDLDHIGMLLANVRKGDPIDVGFRREWQGRLYDGEVHLHAR